MPTYEIQTKDGQFLEVEQDHMPTEDEIFQISNQFGMPQYPKLPEDAKLPDFLQQPDLSFGAGLATVGTPPPPMGDIPEISSVRGGENVPEVVEQAKPGSVLPHELTPAIRLVGGQVVQGEWGDTHPDIIKRHELDAKQIDQRGFFGKGKFWPRIPAATGSGLPTDQEDNMLHSTDLPAIAGEPPPATPEQLAYQRFKAEQQAPGQIRDVLAWKYGGYAQIPEFLRKKALPERTTMEQAAYAVGAVPLQMGKVVHGIEADITRTIPERLGGLEKEGGTWRNLQAAIYDVPEEDLPVSKELSRETGFHADLEAAIGSAAQMGGELLGVAATTTMGIPAPLSASTLFGLSAYSKTNNVGAAVQAAAIGYAFPKVDQAASTFASRVTARLLVKGEIDAAKAKAIEAGIKIGAQTATLNALSAPDYMEAPEQWRRTLMSNMAQAAMFSVNDVVRTLNPHAKPLAVNEIKREMYQWLATSAPKVARIAYEGTGISAEARLKGVKHALSAAEPGTPQHYALRELRDSLVNREKFENDYVARGQKKTGTKWTLTDEQRGSQMMWTDEEGNVTVSRPVLHFAFERQIELGKSKDAAIDSSISEEFIHSVIRRIKGDPVTGEPSGDQMARDIAQMVSPALRAAFTRAYLGKPKRGRKQQKISDTDLGHEILRYAVQAAMNVRPQELVLGSLKNRLSNRFWLTVAKALDLAERKFPGRKDTYREEILRRAITASKEAAKGVEDASEIEKAAALHGDVRAQPVEGVREVSAEERGKGVQPPAEEVAKGAQVSLEKPTVVSREPAGKGKETVVIQTPSGQETITAKTSAIDKIVADVEKVAPAVQPEGPPPAPAAKVEAKPPEPSKPTGEREAISTPTTEPKETQPPTPPPKPERELPPDEARLAELNRVIEDRDLTGPEIDEYQDLLDKLRKGPAMQVRGAEPPEPGRRKRTLRAAIKLPDGSKVIGRSHGEILFQLVVDGRQKEASAANLPQNKIFVDENGNELDRAKGADRFFEITGRRPRIPDALLSEDIIDWELEQGQGPAMRVREVQDLSERVSKMSMADFTKEAMAFKGRLGGGITGWAHDVGSKVTSQEELATLSANAFHWADVAAIGKATGDFDKYSEGGFKKQFFSEAFEAATGIKPDGSPSGSIDSIRSRHDANYVPPMRDGVAMRLHDMDDEQMAAYLRPIILAAQGDPERLARAHEAVQRQLQEEAEAESVAKLIAEGEAAEAAAMAAGTPQEALNFQEVNFFVDSYLGRPVMALKRGEAQAKRWKEKMAKRLAEGKPIRPVREEYAIPRFDEAYRGLKEIMPGLTVASFRQIWADRVPEYLLNASGERLEELRRGFKLEGRQKYGTRKIIDARHVMTDEERADYFRQTANMSEKELAAHNQQIADYLRAAKQYRMRIITELMVRMWNQALPRSMRRSPLRIAIDQFDFTKTRTKLGAYYEFSPSEAKDLGFLNNFLDDAASEKGTTTRTITKRVTILVDRQTGNVELVSTYRQPKTKRILVYDPVMPATKTVKTNWDYTKNAPIDPKAPVEEREVPISDKMHKNIESLMKRYRVFGSILLEDPVQNFHMRFEMGEGGISAMDQFNAAMGDEARARASHIDKIWQQFTWGRRKAKTAELEEPETRLVEEQVRGPRTEAERARASLWQEAESVPESVRGTNLGLFRSALKQFSRGHMSTAEARGLYHMLDEAEVSGPADIATALQTIVERWRTTELGKRRGITGDELCALVGMDKIARKEYFARRQEADVKKRMAEFSDAYDRAPQKKGKDRDQYLEHLNAAKKKYLESVKLQAMWRAQQEAYEIYRQAKEAESTGIRQGPSPYEVNFVANALDVFGDNTRRAFERSQKQEVAPAASGARSLIEGLAPRQPRPPFGRPDVSVRYPEKFPLAGRPAEMMTPAGARETGEAAKRAFPYIPTEALTRMSPMLFTPKGAQVALPPKKGPIIASRVTRPKYGEAETAPLGPRPQGFVPRAPSMPELIARARAEQAKAKGPAMQVREYEYGVSVTAREERARLGAAMMYESGEGLTTDEAARLIQWAQGEVERGPGAERAKAAVAEFEEASKTGKQRQLGREDQALVYAYGEYLLRDAEEKMATHGRRSKEYHDAFMASVRWDKRTEPLGTEWSVTGALRQVRTEVDTGNVVSMERDYTDRTGFEFDEGEAEEAQKHARKTRKAKKDSADQVNAIIDTVDKLGTPELDAQTESLAQAILRVVGKMEDSATERIRKRRAEGRMFSAVTIIPPEDLADYAIIGASKMVKLSVHGALKVGEWRKAMVDHLGEYIRPHLDQIYVASQKERDRIIREQGLTEPANEPARQAVTRRDLPAPTTEEFRKQIAELGDKTPAPHQAMAAWKYVKKHYLHPADPRKAETDFATIKFKMAQTFGMSIKQVARLLSANKTMRKMSDELWKRKAIEDRVVRDARNWLKNLENPWYIRWTRRVPRIFFGVKVMGHGTVGLITHAGNMIFDPMSWKTYFPEWINMYKFVYSPARHAEAMAELVRQDYYVLARRAGLQVDPYKFSDDYSVERISKKFAFLIGNRGFDALKTLRMARFTQVWKSLPEELQTRQMAELLANDINHATGVVKSRAPEWTAWAMFAPKLEASRWQWLIADNARAVSYLVNRGRSTPEQVYWAKHKLFEMGTIVGTYFAFLAMNQGFIWWFDWDEKINYTNPRKTDWLSFKVPGYKIGIVGPTIGMIRMFFNMWHAMTGERTRFQQLQGSRYEEMGKVLSQYARGKASPFASTLLTGASQAGFRGEPVPWSRDRIPKFRRRQGIDRYSWGEYTGETVAPIPLEEGLRIGNKDVVEQMKEIWRGQGMNEKHINKILQAGAAALFMAGTGARVSEDIRR